MTTVLEEMGQLIRSTPGPDAPPAEVAHWYELKAHMLELVADEDLAGRSRALRQAAAARRHASALQVGSTPAYGPHRTSRRDH